MIRARRRIAALRTSSARFAWILLLFVSIFSIHAAYAVNVPPPQPDPGLENSIHDADLIVEAEILSGGPFESTALVKKVWRSSIPAPFGIPDFLKDCAISLTGYNSTNGDTAHGGFATGTKYLLFLSVTHEPLVFAPLTPTAPRLLISGDTILIPVGDPPAPVSVNKELWDEALTMLTRPTEKGREFMLPWVRKAFAQQSVESRYLAVTMAGIFKQPGCEPILAEAAQATLLRLRLTVVNALKQLNTPDARQNLRAMLKDDKESVARAAALALADLNDYGALEDLLTWAVRAHKDLLALSKSDNRRTKVLEALDRVLLMAEEGGPLLDPDKPLPILLDLARSPETSISTGALYVMGGMIRKEQMPALQELAENPAFENRRAALFALFRATLVPPKETGEQSALWKRALDPKTGECWREEQVVAAANALFKSDNAQDRQYYRAILRVAPAEQALPALGKWWMKSADPALYSADEPMMGVTDFALWRSPLALPFLVERLGSDSEKDRTEALLAIASISKRFPRIGTSMVPLTRALLYDPVERVRNAAAKTASVLNDNQAIPPLTYAIDPEGDLSLGAGTCLFDLSSRTLGFGGYEALADIQDAYRRIQGWRESSSGAALIARPLNAPAFPLSSTEREQLLKQFPAPGIRTSNAAYAALVNDSFEVHQNLWLKCLGSASLREQNWGLAATLGAPEAFSKAVNSLNSEDDFTRALLALNLGALSKNSGFSKLAAGVLNPGKALGQRRLEVLALGLGSGHAESLAALKTVVEKGLAAETDSTLKADKALLYPALIACAARNDATPLLISALETTSPNHREFLLRTLAFRTDTSINSMVSLAFAKLDVYQLASVARLWSAKCVPASAPYVLKLLKSSEASARLAAAIWLHDNLELARKDDVRIELMLLLDDPNSGVRAYAAKTLGILKERRALQRLGALTSDYVSEVSASAALALLEIGDPDGVLLAAQGASKQTRLDSRWMRAYGAGSAAAGLEFLFKLVRADNWIDRRNGLYGLSGSAEPQAFEKLWQIYRDGDSIMRDHAAEALREWIRLHRDMDSRKMFFAQVDQELSAQEPAAKVRVLGLIGEVADESSASFVIRQLESPDAVVQVAAKTALYRLIAQLDLAKIDAPLKPTDAVRLLQQAGAK